MDIWETNKLLLFIGFVIPGFVSLKTYALLLPSTPKDSAAQLVDAVAYSCINYALLVWPIYLIDSNKLWITHEGWYIAFCVFALLIAPILWAFLFKKVRETEFVRRTLPHPTARPWDYVFGQGRPYWIIVTLKDGKKVGGRYDTKSFASSAPAIDQLYLEEAWLLNEDDGFERQRTKTAGVMILASDLVTIEFFEITYGETNVGQEAT
jgi:hypothetical protein